MNPLNDKDNGYIVSDEVYDVVKNKKGDTVTTKELHNVLLEILLELDRVCRKNNIGYALAFGSALGMYNYHGFIPWDDDADVVILYEDLPRLIEAFDKDLGKDFMYDCYEKDQAYNVFLPTMKLRKKNTQMVEKNDFFLPSKTKNKDGVFVDIVVMMELPKDKKEHQKLMMPAKRRIYPMNIIKVIFHVRLDKAQAKLKAYEKEVYERYRGSGTYGQTILIPYQGMRKEIDKLLFDKDVILPFKEYDFMGHKLYSFNKLEEFLIGFYSEKSLKQYVDGKWVDPYPKNRRKSDHYKRIKL